ncbi:unnamed protein product [Schistosoma curassoni]|uniref:Glycoprotein n=1 Tax=Schistosoma curassoni TaxID=6186 RepID=A0A183JML6_9TREM|nr:unnamed protein product [Schistosoma curassoni]
MSIVYLLLFIIILFIIPNLNCITTEYSLPLNKYDEYHIQWSVNYDNNEVKWLQFNVCYNLNTHNHREWEHLKFFGIGFGKTDELVNLDMYLLYFPLYMNETTSSRKDSYLYMVSVVFFQCNVIGSYFHAVYMYNGYSTLSVRVRGRRSWVRVLSIGLWMCM